MSGADPRVLSDEEVRGLRADLDAGQSIAGWENDLLMTLEALGRARTPPVGPRVKSREPITKAGKRLLNWADSDMSDITPSNFDTVARSVVDIENELFATVRPTTLALDERLDLDRLAEAHRNLFMDSGYGFFGGYVEALASEYERLGKP